ncbi:MAG: hypothetical protein FD180_821 [Planctomycetota bacterium]|nr:MAG: hypothetical protein FD180_821 [Planctomycetota bacterium]
MPRTIGVFLILLGSFSPAFSQESPSAEVARLLRQLDDDDVAVRDEATLRLIEFGPEAEAALRAAGEDAPPETRGRLVTILQTLSWEVPAPARRKLGGRLSRFPVLKPADRVEILQGCGEDLGSYPLAHAFILALAMEREGDNEAKREITGMMAKVPGSVHLLARRLLQQMPGAEGVAAIRQALASFPRSDDPHSRIEAPTALCVALHAAGMADLATPGLAAWLLAGDDRKKRADVLCEAAAALEKSGHAREAILLYRRSILLDAERLADLRRLDALCTRENWGAAHLALLRWISTPGRPAGAVAEEIALQQSRLEDLAKAGNLPAVDLSGAARLHGWSLVPHTRYHLVGKRAIYSAGSHPHRIQLPIVAAYDLRTSALLWVHVPTPEPATRLEMSDERGGCLLEIPDGLLVLQHADSKLGSGGTLDRSARRTRLLRLSTDGKEVWRREYDLNPGMRFEVLDADWAQFLSSPNQSRGRAWFVRLTDGQIMSSMRLSAHVATLPGGRVLAQKSRSWEMTLFDPRTSAAMWEKDFVREVKTWVDHPSFWGEGEALYATTGRHALRLEAATGKTVWMHEFDADETTVGILARGDDVFAVLKTGGNSWKCVKLAAAGGDAGGDFEGPCGRDPQDDYGVPVRARWVAKDAFELRGRIVDIAGKRVLTAGIARAAGLPPLADAANFGSRIRVSAGDEPVPYLDFGAVIARVNSSALLVPLDALLSLADEWESSGKESHAEELRRVAADLDPLDAAAKDRDD